MTRFVRYLLRTTDPERARAFYTGLLGRAPDAVAPLPEAARARGAVAHWLGHLAVDDVGAAAAAWIAHGGLRLAAADGDAVVMRDVGGAVFALTRTEAPTAVPQVLWHQLVSTDVPRSIEALSLVCDWHFETVGSVVFPVFSWREDHVPTGAVADAAQLPGAHPHWLFFFPVASIEAAVAWVAAEGGKVLRAPDAAQGGTRLAVCEDAQGAAFGLAGPPAGA